MYKLGDILEFSYVVIPKDGKWRRVLGYACVVEIKAKGIYKIRDIERPQRSERSYTVTDNTSGYRRVGNIWESSLMVKVGCAQRKQPR